MRIIMPGQFLQALQLEMTRKEMLHWLGEVSLNRAPVEIIGDTIEKAPHRKVLRHFYVVNGEPVTVYEIPEASESDGEWERKE